MFGLALRISAEITNLALPFQRANGDQSDRAMMLKTLLATNGTRCSRRMPGKDELSKPAFSRLIVIITNDIDVKPFHADRKRHLLILRSA